MPVQEDRTVGTDGSPGQRRDICPQHGATCLERGQAVCKASLGLISTFKVFNNFGI